MSCWVRGARADQARAPPLRRYGRGVTGLAAELRLLGSPNVGRIFLGVDLDVFRPAGQPGALRRRDIPTDAPIALYAGRFCSGKRLGVLVAGHASVPEAEHPWLVLAGDGGLGPWLEAHVSHDRRLTVLPYVRERGSPAPYAAADSYVARGTVEMFGLSIAEAMACGLPVVAVARGAASDPGRRVRVRAFGWRPTFDALTSIYPKLGGASA